jgi:arsenite-transporting ATPase
MVGAERLRELAEALFPERADPAEVLYVGKPYRITREGTAYVVWVELPFANKENIRLSRQGDELLLQVDSWRRTLLLPRALMNARTVGAKMEGKTLRIEFEERAPARAGGTR